MKTITILLSLMIWITCLWIGVELSHRRPLWNDEIYTQVNSIEKNSYADILSGRVPEGNNAPLFYWIQKAVSEGMNGGLQKPWDGAWFVYDDRAQMIWRMVSNVCMSTAIAVLFFLFASSHSIGLAFFAVGVMLSVPSTWSYWVEGRPYALWILLTVLQLFFFIKTVRDAKNERSHWLGLALSHVLLSLTIAFGVAQAVVASMALWIFKERRVVPYVWLAVIPTGLSIFYYQHSPKFKYWFREEPLQLIVNNVPTEYWILSAVCLIAALVLNGQNKENASALKPYAICAGLMVASAFALLAFLKLKASPGQEGFAISSRYFLFLIPVIAIALALSVESLWQRFKNDPWMRMNILIVIGGFLLLRAAKTYIAVLGSGTFMHLIR